MIKSCIRHRSYGRLNVGIILEKLKAREEQRQQQETAKVVKQRQLHEQRSKSSSKSCSPARVLFKCNTKRLGEALDSHSKSVPYIYMPKYEQQTLMLPDRVRAKGKAAKRFEVKMKDSSPYLFRQPEKRHVREAINSPGKQMTIVSRRYQEYTRTVDKEEGVNKAKISSQSTSRHHHFHHSHNHDFFSQCQPMLEPRQDENRLVRKVGLAKTFNFQHSWRPITSGTACVTPAERSSHRQVKTTCFR